MKFDSNNSDDVVLGELGRRLTQARLGHNWSQQDLAGEAGISKRTIERFEAGETVKSSSLIRMLRALGMLELARWADPGTPPQPGRTLRTAGQAQATGEQSPLRRPRTARAALALGRWRRRVATMSEEAGRPPLGTADRRGAARGRRRLGGLPVHARVRGQRDPGVAADDAAPRRALLVPGPRPRNLPRAPRHARRLPPGPLRQRADQPLARPPGPPTGERQRGRAPLLHGHPRDGRARVRAGRGGRTRPRPSSSRSPSWSSSPRGSSPTARASRPRSPAATRKTACWRSSASACRRAARGRRR